MQSKRYSLTFLLILVVAVSVTSAFLTSLAMTDAAPVKAQDGERPEVIDELTARSFVLVDSDGKTLGRWTVSESGSPEFTLRDGNDFPCVGITVVDGKPSIGLLGPLDDGERGSLLLEVLDRGPVVGMSSPTGGSTLMMMIVDNSTPRIQLAKTGSRGSEKIGTFAGLQVSEQGGVFIASPPHAIVRAPYEDLPPKAVVLGRIDMDEEAYGLRYYEDKDKFIDWPSLKEDGKNDADPK